MNFKQFQAEWTPKIDGFLKTKLHDEIDNQVFSEIMSYSVLASGKRLRPLLFLATLNSLNYQIGQRELEIACGIELIHTYSLIHDDLPAMDNDDYRRGKLTSHKKWGEAQAILAGDALLPLGLEWISCASQNYQLANIMSQAIGPNGMVLGQYLDIETTNNEEAKDNQDLINQMEWLKTGCLIKACVEMATVYADADKLQKQKLIDFACAFGRAYQIYDDLVDVVETRQEAGKGTHKDQEEGKTNTLSQLGIAQSQQKLMELIKRAQEDLSSLNQDVLVGFLDLYQKVL